MKKHQKEKTISSPDYKRIYIDILNMKYPEKKKNCQNILQQDSMSAFDVIQINRIIFGWNKSKRIHRSYDKHSIAEILRYQCDNSLNNTELSRELGISRNTIAKWKKTFMHRQFNKISK